MPRKKNDPTKSAAILELLKANPKMPVKEIVSTLAKKGTKVLPSQVYYIKGKIKGQQGRRKKKEKIASNSHDAVAMILKIREWAIEVGGMKKLKELVDALSE